MAGQESGSDADKDEDAQFRQALDLAVKEALGLVCRAVCDVLDGDAVHLAGVHAKGHFELGGCGELPDHCRELEVSSLVSAASKCRPARGQVRSQMVEIYTINDRFEDGSSNMLEPFGWVMSRVMSGRGVAGGVGQCHRYVCQQV